MGDAGRHENYVMGRTKDTFEVTGERLKLSQMNLHSDDDCDLHHNEVAKTLLGQTYAEVRSTLTQHSVELSMACASSLGHNIARMYLRSWIKARCLLIQTDNL